MTLTVPTLAEQQAALLRDLSGVLERHTAATAVRLVFVCDELPLADDEILVQRLNTNDRILELRPVKTSELVPGDVLYNPQDPADSAWIDYAASPVDQEYFHFDRGHLIVPKA
ncbi:hypothetical protein ABZ714_28735 [Streptomyces sp. NPDC006798]|uniref:hypothetical protein n=1 Tax=Streptomyces sp. NPDC006798 TaxID=3155462 RepID=UPI0033E1B07D